MAVVTDEWPTLSHDEIGLAADQELVALERRGMVFNVWTLQPSPRGRRRRGRPDPDRPEIRALPASLIQEPLRALRGVFWATGRAGFPRVLGAWARDLMRRPKRARAFSLVRAAVLARELAPETRALYAHRLDGPGSLARYAALLRGLPWAFSAEAEDVWTLRSTEKREKIREAAFGVAATSEAAAHLASISGLAGKIHFMHRGLDFERAPPPPSDEERRARGGPFVFLSVAPLTESAGFERLIEALARLPAPFDWRWVHIGEGPLAAALEDRAERRGVARRIEWRGKRRPAEAIGAMRRADLFVAPNQVARDGGREGLPIAFLWAASQKLPIAATAQSAVREFIDPGVHGWLMANDAEAMARALSTMAHDPTRRARMAAAAYQRLHHGFELRDGVERLTRLLRKMVGEG